MVLLQISLKQVNVHLVQLEKHVHKVDLQLLMESVIQATIALEVHGLHNQMKQIHWKNL